MLAGSGHQVQTSIFRHLCRFHHQAGYSRDNGSLHVLWAANVHYRCWGRCHRRIMYLVKTLMERGSNTRSLLSPPCIPSLPGWLIWSSLLLHAPWFASYRGLCVHRFGKARLGGSLAVPELSIVDHVSSMQLRLSRDLKLFNHLLPIYQDVCFAPGMLYNT